MLGILHIRYEDVLQDHIGVLQAIASHYKLPMPDSPKMVDRLVGWYPNKGISQGWKDVFSNDDLEYFHSIVPDTYWGLRGYS